MTGRTVMTGVRPSLLSTDIRLAVSSHARARYLAFRLRPKRCASRLLSNTLCDLMLPAAYQMARPTWRDFPGSRAADISQEIGTGPRNACAGDFCMFCALPGAAAVFSLFMARAVLEQPSRNPRCDTWRLRVDCGRVMAIAGSKFVAHGMADYMRSVV